MSLSSEALDQPDPNISIAIDNDEKLSLNALPSEILYFIINHLHMAYCREFDTSVFALLHVNRRFCDLTVRTLMGDRGSEWSEAKCSLATATVLRSEAKALARATQWSLNYDSFKNDDECMQAYVEYFMGGVYGREYDLAIEAAREVMRLSFGYREALKLKRESGLQKPRSLLNTMFAGWFSRSS